MCRSRARHRRARLRRSRQASAPDPPARDCASTSVASALHVCRAVVSCGKNIAKSRVRGPGSKPPGIDGRKCRCIVLQDGARARYHPRWTAASAVALNAVSRCCTPIAVMCPLPVMCHCCACAVRRTYSDTGIKTSSHRGVASPQSGVGHDHRGRVSTSSSSVRWPERLVQFYYYTEVGE